MTIFQRSKPAPARPWSEAKSGKFKAVSMGQMQARLIETPFPGVWLFDGDMPMRRFLALQSAVKAASFNITPAELDTLLVEVYMEAHKEKGEAKIRAGIQSRIENIRARIAGTDAGLLAAMAYPCMVLEDENPFLYESAFEGQKAAVLADPAAEDFFLRKAKNTLSAFLAS